VAAIEATAKKYKHVGYNKAALAFIEAGGNNTKNPRSPGKECYLIPSFFMGVDKYWWLNQVTYASQFLARKRFLQRARSAQLNII
jgi:hypothetical protein